jgi:thiosulfate/3-mercaptopyruvate sulfurtransferase
MLMKEGMKMKKCCIPIFFLVSLVLLLPPACHGRDLDPIVSTEWLAANLSNPRLVMIDIRKIEDYQEGHIPGAVSGYYGMWTCGDADKHAEFPRSDDLFDCVGDLGIRADSLVVIVCKTYTCFYQIMAPRVLCTLQYAGIENVGILDGGQDKWIRENRPLSTEHVKPKKTVYRGILNKGLHVEKAFVAGRLGKATFVDTREVQWFSGEKKQDFVAQAGHIPGSVNLPASEAFTQSGTFKNKEELEAIAARVVGTDRSREIITYCDAGRCCPTWAFILTQVLGYKNVKLYDGSFEEWSKDPQLPVTR